MKQSEIKELSAAELQEKLAEFKKNYTDLKMAHAISPLESPLQLNFHKIRFQKYMTHCELPKVICKV